MKNKDIVMQNKVFLWILAGTGMLLLIPLIPMQFSHDVNWTLSDFVVMGILIFTICSMFVLAAREIQSTQNRIIAGVMFFMLFLYIWAELAVGIFTNWGS